jgi:hypothetical protein
MQIHESDEQSANAKAPKLLTSQTLSQTTLETFSFGYKQVPTYRDIGWVISRYVRKLWGDGNFSRSLFENRTFS